MSTILLPVEEEIVEEVVAEPEVVTILRKAREYISDESKWCKETLRTPDGQVCAIGALHYALSGDEIFSMDWDGGFSNDLNPLFGSAKELLKSAIYGSDIGHTIPTFNDGWRTKHKHVLEKFDEAVELGLRAE